MALESCVRDGSCSYSCPVYDDTYDAATTPVWKCVQLKYLFNRDRGLLTLLTGPRPVPAERMEYIGSNVYRCTLCGRCSETCVLGLPTRDLWESLRAIIFASGHTPLNLKQLSETIKVNRNPFGSDHSTRSDWIRYARLDREIIKDEAETVFFVGCASSYKGAARRIPPAVARILDQAGEDWTILGNDEWCCGNPTAAIGDETTLISLAEHNVHEIERRGAKRVATNCPGCLKNLREYPRILGRRLSFKPVHMVELVAEYLNKGRIELEMGEEKISYHDPCELSRLGGIIREPRTIIKNITSNYLELPESGRDARCCGGGGSYQVVDDSGRLSIGKKRIIQVKKLNPEILTSACPNCKITLGESAMKEGLKIKVLDILEVVASHLHADGPTAQAGDGGGP
ncbi:MAG: (Fe-S)-binding protein [Candidatus Bathyarchaeia archaeon]